MFKIEKEELVIKYSIIHKQKDTQTKKDKTKEKIRPKTRPKIRPKSTRQLKKRTYYKGKLYFYLYNFINNILNLTYIFFLNIMYNV